MSFSFAPAQSLLVILPDGCEVELKPWPRYGHTQLHENQKPISRKPSEKIRLGCHRIHSVSGVKILHLDIRTPFGEDVSEAQVETSLQQALGPHRESYTLRGWHVLRIEDTHVGSLHRVIASLDDGDESPKIGPLVDHRLPLELGIIGIGYSIANSFKGRPWQLLFCFGDKGYSVLFRGEEACHIKALPWPDSADSEWQDSPQLLLNHLSMLGDAENEWTTIPRVLLTQSEWVKPSYATSETWRNLDSFLPIVKNSHHDSRVALAIGFSHLLEHRDVLAHDRVGLAEVGALRQKRLLRSCLWSTGLSALASLLIWVVLMYSQHTAERTHQALLANAAGHRLQVENLASLRNQLIAKRDSLTQLGNLAIEPYPTSLVLHGLAAASVHGGVSGLQLRREATGELDLKIRAWTASWELVDGFRHAISVIPEAQMPEITEQRKESGQGKVSFDIGVRIAQP
jgi:hypothetical protein